MALCLCSELYILYVSVYYLHCPKKVPLRIVHLQRACYSKNKDYTTEGSYSCILYTPWHTYSVLSNDYRSHLRRRLIWWRGSWPTEWGTQWLRRRGPTTVRELRSSSSNTKTSEEPLLSLGVNAQWGLHYLGLSVSVSPCVLVYTARHPSERYQLLQNKKDVKGGFPDTNALSDLAWISNRLLDEFLPVSQHLGRHKACLRCSKYYSHWSFLDQGAGHRHNA